MKKKWLVLLVLVFTMSMILAACGDEKTGKRMKNR